MNLRLLQATHNGGLPMPTSSWANPPPACPAASLLSAFALALLGEAIREDHDMSVKRGDNTGAQFDFIVVGAGAAGSVVASRLSEQQKGAKPFSVLLLESGGQEPAVMASYGAWYEFSHFSPMNWAYKSEAQPTACGGTGCRMNSGRGLGGSSSINGMQYVRGNKRDFENWAAMGLKGWTYEDVLPFYKKSENSTGSPEAKDTKYHGTKGPITMQRFPYYDPNVNVVLESLGQAGLKQVDVNGASQIGYEVFQSMIDNGRRRSANLGYIQPNINRPNLKVTTWAHVTRVIIDPKTKKATGVEYEAVDGKKRIVKATKEVILSAGTVRSPQILMLSGIGPKAQLEKLGIDVIADLPVGQNLQDTPAIEDGLKFTLPRGPNNGSVSLEKMVNDLQTFLYPARGGPMAANPLRRIVGFADFTNLTNDYPNIQLRFFPTLADESLLPKECVPKEYMDIYYDDLHGVMALQGAKSRGYVELRSKNHWDQPKIFQNYYDDKSDILPMIAAFKFLAKLGDTKAFTSSGWKLDKTKLAGCDGAGMEWGTDKYWDCVVRTRTGSPGHFTSTNGMGKVLDDQLRVFNITGLRVMDASAMPMTVHASTYSTTLMIAEKGSHMVKLAHGVKEDIEE